MRTMLKTMGHALLALTTWLVPVHGQGTDAVVLVETNAVDIYSNVAFSFTKHRAVRIQNDNGAHHADFSIYMTNDMSMDKFQLTLSDASGHLLRTFKQKDLMRTEFSEGLAADGYMLYLNVTPPSYPVVVACDITVNFKRNNVSFPIFSPLDSYNTEVEKATYDITYPSDYPLRYKVVNSSVSPSKTSQGGKTCLHFQFDNINAIKKSEYGLPLSKVSPKVYFAPSRFSYFKTTGSLLSWDDLGAWEHSLFSDRGTFARRVCRHHHRRGLPLPPLCKDEIDCHTRRKRLAQGDVFHLQFTTGRDRAHSRR